MTSNKSIKIIDLTDNSDLSIYLHRCFVGPFRKYRRREAYLSKAIPRGFHKKMLIFNDDRVGTIEYSPPAVSYYPIHGQNILVLNCIWVLSRAKGHGFGKLLFNNMLKSEPTVSGIATIALEGHWSPWFVRGQMEKFGFEVIDSLKVTHKRKHQDKEFFIHLMWLPLTKNAPHPIWDKEKLLEGVHQCLFHPLYHPISYVDKYILKIIQ